MELERILRAIECIGSVEGAELDADALADDAFVLGYAFPDADDYEAAIQATVRALELIVSDRVSASQLTDDYEGWTAYHYQHRVGQGAKADMRIMFRRAKSAVQVRGFGHRRQPADFYRRMSESIRPR